MKFAAKRTWPEKSSSWEHEGDAASAEAFASEFAAIEQLALDTELVVMTKEGESQGAQFFKVTSHAPYQVTRTESHSTAASVTPPVAREGGSAQAEATDQEVADEPVGLPSLRPVISMIFYMGKVAFIATASIAVMAVVITYLKKVL